MTDSVPAASPPSLLRDRAFAGFVLAKGLSTAGSVATLIALPVLVYRTSGDAGLTALVAGIEAAPYLLFGLFAGALSDRWDRKKVMVRADVLSTCLLATIPIAHVVAEVTIAHVFVVAFLGPAIGVFFDGAVFGAVPMIVGRGRIGEANSIVWSVQSVVEIVVPSVVGASLALLDPAWLLGVDAVTYAASAALIAAIHRPMYDASRERPPLTVRQILRDVGEGLGFLWGHRGVRSMTVIGFLLCASLGGYLSLVVVWLDRVLGLGTEGWRFGVTYGSWAVGGLAAALVLPKMVRFVTPARIALVAMPISGVFAVVVSQVTVWWVAAVLMVFWAAAATMVMINSVTYRQEVSPERLLGRVSTAGRMIAYGLGWTCGALVAGVVVGPLGLRPTLFAFACISLVGGVYGWLSPLRRIAAGHESAEAPVAVA